MCRSNCALINYSVSGLQQRRLPRARVADAVRIGVHLITSASLHLQRSFAAELSIANVSAMATDPVIVIIKPLFATE